MGVSLELLAPVYSGGEVAGGAVAELAEHVVNTHIDLLVSYAGPQFRMPFPEILIPAEVMKLKNTQKPQKKSHWSTARIHVVARSKAEDIDGLLEGGVPAPTKPCAYDLYLAFIYERLRASSPSRRSGRCHEL